MPAQDAYTAGPDVDPPLSGALTVMGFGTPYTTRSLFGALALADAASVTPRPRPRLADRHERVR